MKQQTKPIQYLEIDDDDKAYLLVVLYADLMAHLKQEDYVTANKICNLMFRLGWNVSTVLDKIPSK